MKTVDVPDPLTERVADGVPVPIPRRVLTTSKKKLGLSCERRPPAPINGTEPWVRFEKYVLLATERLVVDAKEEKRLVIDAVPAKKFVEVAEMNSASVAKSLVAVACEVDEKTAAKSVAVAFSTEILVAVAFVIEAKEAKKLVAEAFVNSAFSENRLVAVAFVIEALILKKFVEEAEINSASVAKSLVAVALPKVDVPAVRVEKSP